MATGFYQFYRDIHSTEIPAEVLAQLKAQGVNTNADQLSGIRRIDFAGGTVVRVTPVSLVVFLPIALIFGAYFLNTAVAYSWLGRSAIALASLTFLGEVGILALILHIIG